MGNLSVTFYGENLNKTEENPWPMLHYSIANIECEDVLEGLAILHERLNAVAMPRIHQPVVKSTADLPEGYDFNEVLKELQAEDKFVTVSC